jgi:hypothetical protein
MMSPAKQGHKRSHSAAKPHTPPQPPAPKQPPAKPRTPAPSPKGPVTLTPANIGSVVASAASITSLQLTAAQPPGPPEAGTLTLVENTDPAHPRTIINMDTLGISPGAGLVGAVIPFGSLKVSSVPAGSSWTVVVG